MKNIFLLVLFSLGFSYGFSQIGGSVQSSQSTEKKWRLGASAGISFGDNDYLALSIAPSVGYNLGYGLELGATLGYQLNKNNYFRSNLISGGPYINYMVVPQIFGRVHYEYYTGNQKSKISSNEYNINESALWIGGGYESGGAIRFRAGILYNVLYKENNNSIFSSAIRPFAGIVIAI
ncbi:hypothetical protein KRX57_09375 [Weeksellaceae bacterium TAE3-ERU29]|nr:hypothetical protein [Weeksellaceae bacterium TAE3-ERU29]